jgi:hypothetical protein
VALNCRLADASRCAISPFDNPRATSASTSRSRGVSSSSSAEGGSSGSLRAAKCSISRRVIEGDSSDSPAWTTRIASISRPRGASLRRASSTAKSRRPSSWLADASPRLGPLPAADVGDLLGQLEDRCPDRVPQAARGSAQAAAARQPGGCLRQRRRPDRSPQCRLRRRQGQPALHPSSPGPAGPRARPHGAYEHSSWFSASLTTSARLRPP